MERMEVLLCVALYLPRNELVLRTPPSEDSGVTVVNELSWKREVPAGDY